ncbi:MAG: hypothetical protein IKY89_00680 [Alistipes sp.]|nr:hypothetical protein [Alistipes sp.]
MKVFRIIVSILLAVGSVAAVGLAVMNGMKAPESSKITNSTPLVQNVATVDEGIEKLGEVFAGQIGEDMLTEEAIVEEQAKLDRTVNEFIPAYEAKVAAKEDRYNAAQAEIAQLGELKSLNAKQKKQLKDAEAVVADYKATADTLNIYKTNVEIMEDNIAASKLANENAKIDGENAAALAKSVSNTIYWCYALFAIILVIAVFSACADLFISFAQNWKKALIKLVVGVAIVGIIYVVANYFVGTHGWLEGNTLKDAAGYDLGLGTDPATRQVFGASDYIKADFGLIVCYIVAGAAVLSAVISVVIGFFKK